jgi:hypothetical protein
MEAHSEMQAPVCGRDERDCDGKSERTSQRKPSEMLPVVISLTTGRNV